MTAFEYALTAILGIILTLIASMVRGSISRIRKDLERHEEHDREDLTKVWEGFNGFRAEVHADFIKLTASVIEALRKE